MSGYLGYLVQRSLTAVAGVRPKPVSIFEPGEPPATPEVPPASMLGLGPNSSPGDHNRKDLRLSPDRDADSRSMTPSTLAASPGDAGDHSTVAEAAPRPDHRLPPRSEAPHGKPQSPPYDESRYECGPTAAPAEAYVREPFAKPESQTIPTASREEEPHPVTARGQHPTVGRETSSERRGHLDATLRAATEPGPLDWGAALRSRGLLVQGKPVAEPGHESFETPPERPSYVQGPFSTPADPVQTVHSESVDLAAVAEPKVRPAVRPAKDLHGGASRDKPSTLVQAILAPRLPQHVPVAPPLITKTPEPVVHVTIGRVEIRAVPAPVAPKRSAPAKPTLSLSDYLNRRKGGQG